MGPGDGGQEPNGQKTQAWFSWCPASGPKGSLGTGGPRLPARPLSRHRGSCGHFCRDLGCLPLAPRMPLSRPAVRTARNPRAVLISPSGPQPELHSLPGRAWLLPPSGQSPRPGCCHSREQSSIQWPLSRCLRPVFLSCGTLTPREAGPVAPGLQTEPRPHAQAAYGVGPDPSPSLHASHPPLRPRAKPLLSA